MRGRLRFTDGKLECRRGFMLLECLVYMSLWLIIVGMALQFFYQAYAQSKNLARNADDIVRALKAGEVWRAEVRGSALPPRWEPREDESGRDLVLGTSGDWTAYRCTMTNLLRRTATDPRWREVLGRLRGCEFHRDEHGPVVSWRWELELSARVQEPSVQPRFTFQAVASAAVQQP